MLQEDDLYNVISEETLLEFHRDYKETQPLFRSLGFELKVENGSINIYDLTNNLIGPFPLENNQLAIIDINNTKLCYQKSKTGRTRRNKELITKKAISLTIGDKILEIILIDEPVGIGSIPVIEVRRFDPEAEQKFISCQFSPYLCNFYIDNRAGIDQEPGNIRRSLAYSFDDEPNLSNIIKPRLIYFENHFANGNFLEIKNKLKNNLKHTESFYQRGCFLKSISREMGTENEYLQNSNLPIEEAIKQMLGIPRLKNTIEFVMKEIDNAFPGIEEHIIKKYKFKEQLYLLSLTERENIDMNGIQQLLADFAVPGCDLPKEKEIRSHNTRQKVMQYK